VTDQRKPLYSEDIQFPSILERRTDWLNKDTKAKTVQERVKELVDDEEKYYGIIFAYINRTKIPPIPNVNTVDPNKLAEDLLNLLRLKQEVEEEYMKCNSHTLFLSKKVSDLGHTSSIEGLKVFEITNLRSRCKDFLGLFKHLTGMFKLKIAMINSLIATIKNIQTTLMKGE
jgi:hypothetical protein